MDFLDRTANRFVQAAAPDDPYLPPPEPAWRQDKPDARSTKPPNSDGRVATAFGAVPPLEFRALRRRGALDAHGGLAVKPAAIEARKPVRQRSGARVRVPIALTLEEFLQHQDRRRQLEGEAEQYRAQSAEQVENEPSRPMLERSALGAHVEASSESLAALRAQRHPWPEPVIVGFHAGRPEVTALYPDEWPPFPDRYDRMAAEIQPPAASEEERAWELSHGLAAGSLAEERAAEEAAEQARAEAEQERRAVAALAASWQQEIADRVGRCQNPAGCSNPVQNGRGTRCKACYEWRRRHRSERPLARLNIDRRRLAS